MNQIKLHNQITSIIQGDPNSTDKESFKKAVFTSEDTKDYFYSKATPEWLDWLWRNEFLDAIKKESEDPTKYRYETPELNYLVRITEEIPEGVSEIIIDNETATSENNFNPEVVDRFLKICSNLPAEYLPKIIHKKIKGQHWPKLMSQFNDWGFEYKDILETLEKAGKYESIIELSEALLEIKTKEELGKEQKGYFSGTPFYVKNLSYTEVFDHLANIKEKDKKVFNLVIDKISTLISLGGNDNESDYFDIKDKIHLYDVDFFNFTLDNTRSPSYRSDTEKLFAVAKILAEKILKECFKENCEYINEKLEELPKSRVSWRFKLFVWSRCLDEFKDKLEDAFFRIFNGNKLSKNYSDFLSGAEYLKALKITFNKLDEDKKEEYINKVINTFYKEYNKKKDEDWLLRYGGKILSVLKQIESLPEEKENEAEEKGFPINKDFKPTSIVSGGDYAGSIRSRGPISQKEFGKLDINEIVKRIKNEWTPKNLAEKNTTKDFHNPRNAEGLGQLIRNDIKKSQERFNEYINKSEEFLNEEIHPHYVYSLTRGIEEALKDQDLGLKDINWDNLIKFCMELSKKEKVSDPEDFGRSNYDTFLSGWRAAHQSLPDVIREIVDENNKNTDINFTKYRDKLLKIIDQLLHHPNPGPEDDEVETTSIKEEVSRGDYRIGDPYARAINSVRGRTFQVFVMFLYRDGDKLKNDVKDIYKKLLDREDTQPLMFLFGYYLASFYFRDKKWTKKQLNKIFFQNQNKYDLYLAAWEGYLANNIYKEIFQDESFQELYKKAINLDPSSYTERKYFRELDKGLAIHLSLAFMNFEDFGFSHSLFEKFWNSNNGNHLAEFVSFIGKRYISGDYNPEKLGRKRMKELWEKTLNQKKDNKKALKQFGFWINVEKEIFDVCWLAKKVEETLNQTGGVLQWDYGLQKSISTITDKAPPKNTIKILKHYFIEGFIKRDNKNRTPLLMRENWTKAFEILYKKEEKKTYELINDLIEKGGKTFWKLEDIVKN